MAAWLAPALGVVGSLVSGLLGSKKKEEKTTSEIDYVKMRQNAEAAGFNPLTALRAGGGAGFTTTHHPALASGAFIGDAIAGMGNVIAAIDPMRDATAKLEHQIKQATLANLQADTAARKRASLGGVPVSTGARTVKASSPLATKLPASAGASRTPTVETPTITNPYPTDWGVNVNPNLPDATAYEDRYGEPGSWVGGILTGAGDLYGMASDRYDRHRKTLRSRRYPVPQMPAGYDDLGRQPRKYIQPALRAQQWRG